MKSKRPPLDWPAAAAALAQRIPCARFHPGAMMAARADFLRQRRKGETKPPRWAVALSGGADSLALLLALWAEGPGRWRRKLVALHFNHRLRGREATADATFCRRVCAALGVPLIVGRWRDPPKAASEADARTARHDFFRREMQRRKLNLLWLGHQQDDVAETMLMRLARGSGTAGLAAPRPAQAVPDGRWHLRPLLTLKKAEIIAALRFAGVVWREDATNTKNIYFRNRVRRSVVPAWTKAAGRDALAGAARARELLEEDDRALETWLDEIAPLRGGRVLDLHRLDGCPRAIVRRALHRWLLRQPEAGDLSRQAFEALLVAVEQGRPTRHSLGRDGFGVISDGALRFERVGKRAMKLHRRAN